MVYPPRMAISPTQLDYAPQGPWHRRARLRQAILVIAILVVVLASMNWLSAGWRHAQLLYWRRLCLRHDSAGSQTFDDSGGTPPKQWDRFYTLFSPPGRRHDPVLFIHELKRRDGQPRLIAIELSAFQ